MKVFVTGASGFIGSHVVQTLLSRGHKVAILAPGKKNPWRLKEIYGKITQKRGKLDDRKSLRKALAGFKPDACIHLAWYAEPGKYLHSAENLSSLNASLVFFNELISAGCRQIVAAGTCAEYAYSKSTLKENSPTGPTTLYAAAKLACSLVGRQLAGQAKVKFAWGRIFYPYGPKEDGRRVVPAVIQSLLKGRPFAATAGKQVRDYIFVEDAAAAFCTLAEKKADGVFNICSGNPISVRHLLGKIGEEMGWGELIHFGAKPQYAWEPPVLAGDNHRLRNLGWKPRFGLDEGIEKTVRWWKQGQWPA